MTATVHITIADIAAGEPGNPFRCPMALALARALGQDVSVVGPRWRLRAEVRTLRVMPRRAWAWVVRFDQGEAVAPATFRFTA